MEEKQYKLPVISIVIEAIKSVWRSKEILLLKTGAPIVILITLEIIDSKLPESSGGTTLLLGVITFFFYTLLAVNCHRIALLNSSSVNGYGIRFFSKREWRFTGWLISIYLLFFFLVMIITTTSAFITSAIGVYASYAIHSATMLLGFYTISRLIPMLPATAIDYDPDIYWAWDISSGNGWRLVIIICALPFLTGTLVSLLNEFGSNIMYIILKDILSYIFVIFEIFALSLSFKYLQKNNSNKALKRDSRKNVATPLT